MASRTTDQWIVNGTEKGFDELEYQKNVPVPNVGDNDVLVRLHGATLNYRDLIIPKGKAVTNNSKNRECIPSP
ncbi:hypothetical protein MAPG_06042 [Magnaporthiopsis poae ATCC 64411]|uniref:Uncharacterized protein n=1 Tax=Magnaporthiopsis poae (strain ATCC 64411 / 73-15) TaxID=644358 RepID=A0A0C4E0Z8_MAGP6|nr:hypothetical protein MAPG_06042 [Magnaporthiopsis poae ATCC 64411]